MIKAIIFDLDGTLIPFTLNVNTCRTKILDYLIAQGFPKSLFSMKENVFEILEKIKKHLKDQEINNKKFSKIEGKIFSIVDDFELETAKATKIFPGTIKTLQNLREMKLKIGLCTISGEKATKYILHRFNLQLYFDAVIPRESVSEVKPNPIHLEAALNALEVKSHECVLVGDSIKDVIAALQLNVLTVGMITGISTREELICAGTHYLASSITDIPILITQLNRTK